MTPSIDVQHSVLYEEKNSRNDDRYCDDEESVIDVLSTLHTDLLCVIN
jgi:hypothetical protein